MNPTVLTLESACRLAPRAAPTLVQVQGYLNTGDEEAEWLFATAAARDAYRATKADPIFADGAFAALETEIWTKSIYEALMCNPERCVEITGYLFPNERASLPSVLRVGAVGPCRRAAQSPPTPGGR